VGDVLGYIKKMDFRLKTLLLMFTFEMYFW